MKDRQAFGVGSAMAADTVVDWKRLRNGEESDGSATSVEGDFPDRSGGLS